MILSRTQQIIQTMGTPNQLFETVCGSDYFIQFLSGSDSTNCCYSLEVGLVEPTLQEYILPQFQASRIRLRVDEHERT
jgi:hypothetical protein